MPFTRLFTNSLKYEESHSFETWAQNIVVNTTYYLQMNQQKCFFKTDVLVMQRPGSYSVFSFSSSINSSMTNIGRHFKVTSEFTNINRKF